MVRKVVAFTRLAGSSLLNTRKSKKGLNFMFNPFYCRFSFGFSDNQTPQNLKSFWGHWCVLFCHLHRGAI